MKKRTSNEGSSQSSTVALQPPSDEVFIHDLFKETLKIPSKSLVKDENKEYLEVLTSLNQSSSTNLDLDQIYQKVYTNLHSEAILSNKIKLRQLLKAVDKNIIENCVNYLGNTNFNDFGNLMRIHELILHLSLIGKSSDILQSQIVNLWIEKCLTSFLEDKDESKESFTKVTQALRLLIVLIVSFRDILRVVARTTYIHNVQRARMAKANKNNQPTPPSLLKKKKSTNEEDEEIDPEELMFKEMEQQEMENEEINEEDVDDYFDEEENELLSKAKNNLFNKRIFDLIIQVGEKALKEIKNENVVNFISKFILQYFIEVLDITISQNRFEEISNTMMKNNFNQYLLNLIDFYFESDRLMLEKILLIIISLLCNDKLISNVYYNGLVSKVVKMLLRYAKRGEEGSKFSSYVCSLCCYVVGRICIKDNDIAKHFVNNYVKQNDNELLKLIVTNLVKTNRAENVKHMTLSGLVAIQGILSSGDVKLIIDIDSQTDLIDMIIKDIKSKDNSDYYRDIRYNSMVLLKVICYALNPTTVPQSYQEESSLIFEKILDSSVLQLITDMIQNAGSNKQKKKQTKSSQKQEMEEGMLLRYTRFASIASANAIFQNASKSKQDGVINKLASFLESDQKYREIIMFLKFMETKKTEKTVSPKTLGLVILVFAVFLISLPILFNLFKK
ncbi:hypothetical protein ABK040_014089 [Willaertia magna]